jgi:hypothetical protein
MQSSTQRDVALAHAALEHASYFLELDAPEQAAAYFQFAAKQFQKVSKSLVLQVVWEDSLRRYAETNSCDLAVD